MVCAAANAKDCMSMVNRELIIKELILQTEYRGMQKTREAVYEVPEHVKSEALAVYFKQFGQIINVSSNCKLGEWILNIML